MLFESIYMQCLNKFSKYKKFVCHTTCNCPNYKIIGYLLYFLCLCRPINCSLPLSRHDLAFGSFSYYLTMFLYRILVRLLQFYYFVKFSAILFLGFAVKGRSLFEKKQREKPNVLEGWDSRYIKLKVKNSFF